MYSQRLFILLLGESLFFSTAFQIRLPATSSQRRQQLFSSSQKNEDEVPNMDWLTGSLSKTDEQSDELDINENLYVEQHDADDVLVGSEDAPIPSTGISVSDEMIKTQKERFFTELVSVKKGLNNDIQVAQIITTTTSGSFDPVRYLIGLDKQESVEEDSEAPSDDNPTKKSFVLVDIPPFSEQLVGEIRKFMGPNGMLSSILITNKDCIHYDEAPGVFTIRRADLVKWEKEFPSVMIAAYRLDIPRDSRDSVTQILDGYGPFALEEEGANVTFVETGRPLTYEEWDYNVTQNIFAGVQKPPDDDVNATEMAEIEITDEQLYTPEAIRSREKGKRVLAVYTPGRTYGSVSYVFPELKLCCSGFTIPVEDTRGEENFAMDRAGPALDARGYITTSKAGIARQMESARDLIGGYVDRFNVILPSLSDPYFLDGSAERREKELLEIIDQYEKIGQIYEKLGITDWDGEEDV